MIRHDLLPRPCRQSCLQITLHTRWSTWVSICLAQSAWCDCSVILHFACRITPYRHLTTYPFRCRLPSRKQTYGLSCSIRTTASRRRKLIRCSLRTKYVVLNQCQRPANSASPVLMICLPTLMTGAFRGTAQRVSRCETSHSIKYSRLFVRSHRVRVQDTRVKDWSSCSVPYHQETRMLVRRDPAFSRQPGDPSHVACADCCDRRSSLY